MALKDWVRELTASTVGSLIADRLKAAPSASKGDTAARKGLSRQEAIAATALAKKLGCAWGSDEDLIEMFQDPYWPEKQRLVLDTLSEMMRRTKAISILLGVFAEAVRDLPSDEGFDLPTDAEVTALLSSHYDELGRDTDPTTKHIYQTWSTLLTRFLSAALTDPAGSIPKQLSGETRRDLSDILSRIGDLRHESPQAFAEWDRYAARFPPVLAEWASKRPASYAEVLAGLIGVFASAQ